MSALPSTSDMVITSTDQRRSYECLRSIPFDAVTSIAAEHVDQRLSSDIGELAHGPHCDVANLALADISDLFGHLGRLRAKRVETVKIGTYH